MNKKFDEILLIYPGEFVPKPRLPMSILTLANYVILKGLKCKLVDDWNFNDLKNIPWLKSYTRKKIEAISSIARFKYFYHKFEFYSEEYKRKKLKSPFLRFMFFIFVKLFAKIADFRWKHRFFTGTFEWVLWRKLTYYIFKVS